MRTNLSSVPRPVDSVVPGGALPAAVTSCPVCAEVRHALDIAERREFGEVVQVESAQSSVAETVGAMDQRRARADHAVEMAAKDEQTSEKVATSVSTPIATASERPRHVTEGIHRSLADTTSLADHTAADAAGTSGASIDLAGRAESVVRLASPFRVENG